MPKGASYRLLYRGALSLPDSHLLLDGLTFSARLESQTAEHELLENPLTLALESMRGRPSLQFKGVVDLNEVCMDESGGIEIDIHPHAIISQIYFENTFCLLPLPSAFSSPSSSSSSTPSKKHAQCSKTGIKVSLGDSDGPETTEMIIFAKVTSLSLYPDSPPNALRLVVARKVLHPALTLSAHRLPRPDDPTPRKPPRAFIRSQQQEAFPQPDIQRVKRSASALSGNNKRPKLSKDGKGAEAKADTGTTTFKVPNVPPSKARNTSEAKGKVREEPVDVNGDIFSFSNDSPPAGSKDRRNEPQQEVNTGETELERANRNLIKMSVVHHLAAIEDPTSTMPSKRINKSHPEFKELFGWIYRGVVFALRAQINFQAVDPLEVDRLVEMHTNMYVGGHGGLHHKGR